MLALPALGACARKPILDERPFAIVGTVDRVFQGTTVERASHCEVRGVPLVLEEQKAGARSPDVVTRTDAHGGFTLSDTRADAYYVFATCDDQWGGYGGREMTSGRGGQIDLRVEPGYAIAGVVHDAAGQPLAGAEVRAVQSGAMDTMGYCPRMHTGADGRYRFGGLRPDFGIGASLGQRYSQDVKVPPPTAITRGIASITLDFTL